MVVYIFRNFWLLMNNNIKQTLKYIFVFSILNGLFLFLITLRFGKYINFYNSTETVPYFIIAVLGNSFLIVFVTSIFLFVLPALLKLPQKIISSWIILFSTVGIVLILLDFEVYAQYRIHLNAIVFKMVFYAGNEIFHFSWFTWMLAILTIVGVLIIEFIFNKISKILISKRILKRKYVFAFLFVWLSSLLISNFIHAKADVTIYRSVTSIARHIPLYYPLTMKRFLKKYNLVDLTKVQNHQALNLAGKKSGVINYPKHKLKFEQQKDSLNIVIILLDCWRFDMLTQEITPNIYRFSKTENIQKFNNHYSGGNGTRIGVFSLFYGLYGTYWNTMSDEQISPILMDEIIKRNYQIGIFASATLTIPPFNRTIFKNVKNLRTESKGRTASEKDESALEDWKNFMSNLKTGKPFFSFLFFDSIHAYDIPKDYPKVFQPYWERVDHVKLNNNFNSERYKNRYKTSAHFVDSLVGEVLKLLKEKDMLKNCVILITGDHGEEFNENKKNYWGHGGNYTKYQVQVPFVLHFPKMKRKEYNYWTNHTDFVPTIMENIFKIKNPASDYSNGNTLFKNSYRNWMISGGYFNYAIIEKNEITLSFPSGAYEVQDNNANELDKDINYKILKDVLNETTRFYK